MPQPALNSNILPRHTGRFCQIGNKTLDRFVCACVFAPKWTWKTLGKKMNPVFNGLCVFSIVYVIKQIQYVLSLLSSSSGSHFIPNFRFVSPPRDCRISTSGELTLISMVLLQSKSKNFVLISDLRNKNVFYVSL